MSVGEGVLWVTTEVGPWLGEGVLWVTTEVGPWLGECG